MKAQRMFKVIVSKNSDILDVFDNYEFDINLYSLYEVEAHYPHDVFNILNSIKDDYTVIVEEYRVDEEGDFIDGSDYDDKDNWLHRFNTGGIR